MIIKISGTDYNVDEAIANASLGDLLVLKSKMIAGGFPPVSIPFIKNTLLSVGERMENPEFDQDELLGDEDFIATLAGIIYLAQRGSGENVAPLDALNTRMSDFSFVEEPEDEAEDPKAVTGTPLMVDGETAA